VLNIDLGFDNDVVFEGLKHELLYNPREFESFEIFLNISGKGDIIHFEWSYNTQLFKLERIEQMMDALLSTIHRFVNEPKITIREITGISLEQAKQLAIARNNTKASFPKEKSLPLLLQEVAKASGNKTAVVFGKQEYSYSQLENESNALATYLQRAGIRQGHIVGLAVPRGIEMLVCLLAIMKTGAAYLPIDVQYPKARIQYMLDDSKAELLITTNECASLFQNEESTITIENVWPQLSSIDSIQPIITTLPTDLAYLLYTSGSTGQPKGVMIEHRSLVNLLWSMAQKPGMNASDKLLSVTTISFDIV
jgi:non-ribosomal peptide synthetase component F